MGKVQEEHQISLDHVYMYSLDCNRLFFLNNSQTGVAAVKSLGQSGRHRVVFIEKF